MKKKPPAPPPQPAAGASAGGPAGARPAPPASPAGSAPPESPAGSAGPASPAAGAAAAPAAPAQPRATIFGLPISGDDLRAACDQLAARPWLGLAILVAIAFAAYAYAIPNDFVFDDNSTLRKNPLVKDPSRILEFLSTTLSARNYRPIRYLSFVVDYAIGGDHPWIYHVFNSIYHGLTCFFVWRLLLRLAGDARAALAGALLFALHPAHTECVAYISGRRDLLSTLFYLAAFLAFLRLTDIVGAFMGRAEAASAGERSRVVRSVAGRGAAIAALFALALGSKEMAVTFPAMVILHILVFDAKTLRPLMTPRVVLALVGSLSVLCVLAGLVAWRTVVNQISGQLGPWGGSWSVHAMTAVCLVASYLRLCVFPATLLADYSIDAFPLARSLAEPRTIASIAALLVCAVVAIAALRRAPRIAFGIAWFFLALAPVSQIIPYHELGADHYVYLPSVGLCLVAGIGLVRLWDRFGPETAVGLLAVALVAFGVRTEVRIADWRDAESVYRATLATAPRCARAALNLGAVYASRPARTSSEKREALELAAPLYSRAIRIDPEYTYALLSRGRIYKLLGRRREAKRDLEQALECALRSHRSPVPVEEIQFELERWSDVVETIRKQPIAPRSRQLLLLAGSLEKLKDYGGALEAVERALVGFPTSSDGLQIALRVSERLGDEARVKAYRGRIRSAMTPAQRAQADALQANPRTSRIEARPLDATGATGTAIPVRVGVPGEVGSSRMREAKPRPAAPTGAPGPTSSAAPEPALPVVPAPPPAPSGGSGGSGS